MILEKTRKVYSEVDAFLNIVDKDKVNKIPVKLRNLIKEEKMQNYFPQYSVKIPIEKQNISKDAIAMIGLIDLNYWCETKEEKEKLRKIFKENEQTYQEELREKYNPDNIFKDSKTSNNTENIISNTTETTMVIEYKESLYKKILKFIKSLIKKE